MSTFNFIYCFVSALRGTSRTPIISSLLLPELLLQWTKWKRWKTEKRLSNWICQAWYLQSVSWKWKSTGENRKKKIASVVSLINKTRLQRVNPQSLAGPISSSCLHLPLYIYNVSFFLKASEWVLYRCVIFSNLRNNITNTTHPCLDPTWNLKQLFLRNLESL